MKKEMLINVLQPEETRIAILENGVLEELYVERVSNEGYVGNIYKGRIVNIEPSIQAAFVDFGVGRNGFLHISDVDPIYFGGSRNLEELYTGFEERTPRADFDDDDEVDAELPRGHTAAPARGYDEEFDDERPVIPTDEDEELGPRAPTPEPPRRPARSERGGRDRRPSGDRESRDRAGRGGRRGRRGRGRRPAPMVENDLPKELVTRSEALPDLDDYQIEEFESPVRDEIPPGETAAFEPSEAFAEPPAVESLAVASHSPQPAPEPTVPAVEEEEDNFGAGILDEVLAEGSSSGGAAAEAKAARDPATAPPGGSAGGNDEAPPVIPQQGVYRRTDPDEEDSFGSGILDEDAEPRGETSVAAPREADVELIGREEAAPTAASEIFVAESSTVIEIDRGEAYPSEPADEKGGRSRRRRRRGGRGRGGRPVGEEAEPEAETPTDAARREPADTEPPLDDFSADEDFGGPLDELEAEPSAEPLDDDAIGFDRMEEDAEDDVRAEPRAHGRYDEERPQRQRSGRNGERRRPSRGGRAPARGAARRPRQRPPIQEIFRRGQEVLVQVIKEGLGNKGPTLSTYISIPGRYLVLMPGLNRVGVSRKILDDEQRRRLRDILLELDRPRGVGFIIRTAGLDRTKKELERDLAYLTRLWEVVVRRIRNQRGPASIYQESDMIIRTIRDVFNSEIDTIYIDEPNAFERAREFLQIVMPKFVNRLKLYEEPEPLFHHFGIEDEIARIQQRSVPLPHGGSIVIDQTEALVAIDVNSGNFRADDNAEETAYQINLVAAREIARQLRLRDLGGVIVNDFIDMREERHRRAVEHELREAVKRDRARTKILRMSAFGLIEMTRQRIRPSLKRSLYRECTTCRGTGQIKTVESVSIECMRLLTYLAQRDDIHRISLTVDQEIAGFLLNHKRKELAQLEEKTEVKLSILGKDTRSPEEIELSCYDAHGELIDVDLAAAPHR